MDTPDFYDIPIGRYTTETGDCAEDTICLACANIYGRNDIYPDDVITYIGYPDGFTCVECGYVVPCDPDRCTCEPEEEQFYTVTGTGTYFVKAKSADEAETIVYEAMLGNDKNNVLGCGEVHLGGMIVQRGTHYTIPIPEGFNATLHPAPKEPF